MPRKPRFTDDDLRRFAHAAGTDAGNASMRAAGRSKWNGLDYEAARLAYEKLAPSDVSPSANCPRNPNGESK